MNHFPGISFKPFLTVLGTHNIQIAAAGIDEDHFIKFFRPFRLIGKVFNLGIFIPQGIPDQTIR